MRLHGLLASVSAALLLSLPVSGEVSADLATRLDKQIEAALRRVQAPSVSVAVVEDNSLSYVRAFGIADLGNQRPATFETRYAVGSISKQFTAAALLLLQEQGKLSLDDRVSKYFPDLTRASEISIRQPLSHTSGYEDYAPQDYIIPEWTQPTSPAAILSRWARKPLSFDPGTKWQYSNTNYVLAGEIFEKVAGQPLVAFLKEKIFAPLGMTSASDWPPDSPSDARAYTRYALGPARLTKREARGWYFAAGELAMTPSDLAKWDIAFLERRILSAKSWDELTAEVKLNNGDSTHYALGLTLGDFNGMPAFQHGGEVSGFISSNSVFPTRRGAVVVLSNEDVVNLVGPLSRQITTTVFVRPSEPSIPTADVSRILLDLQRGRIDRGLLSPNAASYFSPAALRDCKTSLAPLGKLKSVTGVSENYRGGMTHRSYVAEFAKRTVQLNVYILPDGKYEQFLVVASS
ncbi:MAG TPA: serine hydrolase domain-containing protein [Bryobacteraceae bacterium]|nr:serine hydrolase domain-containing protein [Bryobacteraceae bacterium]